MVKDTIAVCQRRDVDNLKKIIKRDRSDPLPGRARWEVAYTMELLRSTRLGMIIRSPRDCNSAEVDVTGVRGLCHNIEDNNGGLFKKK